MSAGADRRVLVVTVHLEADPLFPITATDAFLAPPAMAATSWHRCLRHPRHPGAGTLSAVTAFPSE